MHDMPRWRQANVTFLAWEQAEQAAASFLVPLLDASTAAGDWWFIRKYPCWRIRYRPVSADPAITGRRLDELVSAGHLTSWTPGIYEPESRAFGGPEAMAVAHRLFHADSDGVLAFLHADPQCAHRREITLMLCSILMRAARQDWYEQGDIWSRVADHRPAPPGSRPDWIRPAAVRRLISADAESQMRDGASLAECARWADAYADAGRELASLAADGRLRRGLRSVLAHHLIFAWNRVGLPYATQSALAVTAKTVVFGPDPSIAQAG
jgi:thiopeptide-type bacteriocin biosynthesis protein